ncbi:MAG: RNA-binding S4 domain-containing protein [Beijerinckiaceae bacterium]|nr:RNA-binding S4 domain-containing protein [Beijerinckiaceae bacterium]
MTEAARQRLDKWLFFARILKSREKAATLIKDGYVRVNGTRAQQPAKLIKAGDVLTISLERQVLVLKVVLPGERRGPATEAQTLYENQSG